MRLSVVALALGACVSVNAFFDKNDHQIFRVRDELRALEGADVTFYDFLEVSPSASQKEIEQANRKKSRLIHPDKARQSFISTFGKSRDDAKAKAAAAGKDKNNNNKAKETPRKKPGVTVRRQPSQKEIDRFTREATNRYQLLAAVNEVLKGEQRARYDHFLRHGFPKWRGTGYYYERYRPGLGTVLLGLFIFGGGLVHYFVLIYSWKRQRDFVGRYVKRAREMAWGDSLGVAGVGSIRLGTNGGTATPPPSYAEVNGNGGDDEDAPPQPRNRREKRAMEKLEKKDKKAPRAAAAKVARSEGISTPQEASLTSGPVGTKKRVQAENGKVLIVDSVGNVYLEEESAEGGVHEYLLDVDEIPKPTFADTAVVKFPKWVYNKSIGRITGKPTIDDIVEQNAADANNQDDEVPEEVQAAISTNPNSERRRRNIKSRQSRPAPDPFA